ncbi:MAG: hypothetical protein LC792_19505 [Actinobacteria bacterium]|nr:hypothetical protein [Actinomycetota bacterium]
MPRATLGASRRIKSRVGVAALAVGLPLVAFAAMAPADGTTSFSGVAAADGVRFTTSAPGFLVVEDFVDGGGPTAQAAVSDVEGNRGFASVPYPGELAIAGPGLFAIATGQQFPGHYPFHVASAHPSTPKNEYEAPGLSMKTQADATSAQSAARFGPNDEGDVGGARSTARVAKEAEGITSEATGVANAVKVGPVEILGFTSTAKVHRAATGQPERSSSMAFRVMKIADTAVGVRDGQFVVAGTTVPLDGFAPVQKALADAGVTVEFVKATDTDDGVVSPGIQITRKQPADAAGTVMVVRYTLGRALAAGRPEAGSGPGLELPAPDFGPPGGDVAPAPVGPADAPAPDITAPAAVSASAAFLDTTAGSPRFASGLSSGPSDSGVVAGADLSAAPPSDAAAAPNEAAGAVDASLAATPIATGPIAPLSSWSFFPMMLLAGAAVAVVALGRKILVRS